MSNHVFALRKKIRHWGYDSFAYAVEAKPGVADVRSYRRLFRDVQPEALPGDQALARVQAAAAAGVRAYALDFPLAICQGCGHTAAPSSEQCPFNYAPEQPQYLSLTGKVKARL